MSTLTSHTFGRHAYRPRSGYRAGSLRQALVSQLSRWGQGVWLALERFGQRRAQAELHRVAALYQSSRPELAAQLQQLAAQGWR